jgi:polysaccharide biosynthesis/export protein
MSIYLRTFLIVTFCLFSSINFSQVTDAQKKMVEGLPPDQRDPILQKMQQAQDIQGDIDEIFEQESTLVTRPEFKEGNEQTCKDCIYGYDFFKYSPSTFAPSNNIAISSDYILGPGDKIQISYFGSYKDKSSAFISRQGVLELPRLGPINLLGTSYTDAVELIENKVKSELVGTNVSITLTELRSISVYILGQAYKPGAYTLSGLSTTTNALFVSGGVNKLGSLRNIEVRRGKKVIKSYDFYDFLLKGSIDSDVRLQDGDIIFIPFISKKVKLGSGFKASNIYEIKDGETIRELVKLAGGYKSGVLPDEDLEINSIDIRTNKRNVSYLSQNSLDLDKPLNDGDIINISENLALLESGTVKISGEVNKPGEYSILKGDTILDVINRAGGYSEDSYSEGAIFTRDEVAKLQKEGFERSAQTLENYLINIISNGYIDNVSEFTLTPITKLINRLRTEEPIGRQIVDVDYLKLKTDPFANFKVQDGDFLFIPKRPESVSIVGEVLNPSIQRFDPALSIGEYINLSGGLNAEADKDKIFIVLPNGQAFLDKRGLLFDKNSSSSILPGSTIVVVRDNRAFDTIKLAEVVLPILSSLATTAAALAVLGNN